MRDTFEAGRVPPSGSHPSSPLASPSDSRRAPFRAHARHAARLHALVVHVESGWQRQASVQNLGLGGACLSVDEPLAPGDTLTLSFTAPTLWDPLVLRARVVWTSPAGAPRRAGVAFEHARADAVFALYELIVAM